MSSQLPALPESVVVARVENDLYVSIRFEVDSPLTAYALSLKLTDWVAEFLEEQGIEATQYDGSMGNG